MRKTKGEETQTSVYSFYDSSHPAWGTWLEELTLPGKNWEVICTAKGKYYSEHLNDCSHSLGKCKVVSALITGTYYTSNVNYAWKYFSPLSIEVDPAFNSRAFQAMKPKIAPEVLAPLELKELVLGWRELLKPLGSGIKGPITSSSNAYLWYNFGIAPTVGSIESVVSGLKQFKARLEAFLSHQGKELTSHYQEVVVVPESDDQLYYYNNGFEIVEYRQKIDEYKATHIATMKYHYKIDGIDGMDPTEIWLKAIGDLLGVSRIIAMSWEATPWSFVVDWFFSVGDFLEQFDKPFLDTTVEVTGYCLSHKAIRRTELTARRQANVKSAGTSFEKAYTRYSCLPDYSYFGIRSNFEKFGIKQITLSAALLLK